MFVNPRLNMTESTDRISTFAPTSGKFVSLSKTFPRTVWVGWANAPAEIPSKKSKVKIVFM
jgi:hypothetical protein